MKMTSTLRNKGFTLVELLVVIAIIVTLAGIGGPVLMKELKKGDRTEAVAHAKSIGLAMFSFDEEWGSYPDDTTAEDIKEDLDTDLPLGSSSSNDYFRQLLAGGYIDQEGPFFAKTSYIKREGDNNVKGGEALAAGEVGFGYIMKSGGKGLSTSGNSARPLICAPLEEGDTSGTFETDIYINKAVVLRIDNSVKVLTVRDKDGKVSIGSGKTLFDTGDDTVWGDIQPEIKAPLVD